MYLQHLSSKKYLIFKIIFIVVKNKLDLCVLTQKYSQDVKVFSLLEKNEFQSTVCIHYYPTYENKLCICIYTHILFINIYRRRKREYVCMLMGDASVCVY